MTVETVFIEEHAGVTAIAVMTKGVVTEVILKNQQGEAISLGSGLGGEGAIRALRDVLAGAIVSVQ